MKGVYTSIPFTSCDTACNPQPQQCTAPPLSERYVSDPIPISFAHNSQMSVEDCDASKKQEPDSRRQLEVSAGRRPAIAVGFPREFLLYYTNFQLKFNDLWHRMSQYSKTVTRPLSYSSYSHSRSKQRVVQHLHRQPLQLPQ